MVIVLGPIGLYYELKARHRRRIIEPLTETLFKLRDANRADRPLMEAMSKVDETDDSTLARELGRIPMRVRVGAPFRSEMIALANKYKEPSLSRTIRLIVRAREASSDISDFLHTAGNISKIEDDMRTDRISRTRLHATIVVFGFLVLLVIMVILKIQFVDRIAGVAETAASEGSAQQLGVAQLDTAYLTMASFHAVALQAIVSGLIAGYMGTGDLRAGIKHILALLGIAFLVWQVAVNTF